MPRAFEVLDFQGKFINSGFLEAFASGISPVASADLGSTTPSRWSLSSSTRASLNP